MIEHIHSKNTPSNRNRSKKTDPKMTVQQMLQDISQDLLQPREQAIMAIMAKAAETKLV